MNYLYYGDNLDVLRRYVKDETVDLIYLDPPFKSNQDLKNRMELFKGRWSVYSKGSQESKMEMPDKSASAVCLVSWTGH